MPSALAEQLANELDIDTEAAERLVADLVTEVRDRLAEDGKASLPGLGTFRADDDAEEFSFEPDAALADAVNHRFVGLEPVAVDVDEEISEYAKNEIFRSEEPEETSPETTADEPAAAAPTPEPEVEPDTGSDADETPDSAPPVDEVEEQATTSAAEERGSELAAAAEGRQEIQQEQTPPESEEEEEEEEEEATGAAAVASASTPEQTPRRERSSRRQTRSDADNGFSPVTWLLALLLLGAVGAGLWYLYSESQSQPPEPATAQQEEPPAGTAPEDAPPTGTPAQEDEPSPSEEETAAPAYELPGGLNLEEGGYSVVIASETDREAAETVLRRYAEVLRGENLAVGVISAEVEGTQRYRVAVGQFESSSEARSTLQRLSDRLPDGAWVYDLDSGT